MSATTLPTPAYTAESAYASKVISGFLVWHSLVTFGTVVGLIYGWTTLDFPLWVKLIAAGLGGVFALGHGYALPFLYQRVHRGRLFSLIFNYLGFVVCLLGSAHFLGIFLGVDALADTFGQGLIFVVTAFVGYLVGTIGDRFEGTKTEQQFKLAGRWIALLSAGAFLLAVEAHWGVWAVLQQLDDLLTITLTAGVFLFGASLWLMWQRPLAEAYKATIQDGETLNGLLFLSPNLIGFMLFFAGPLIFSLYVSFTNWDAFGTSDWVGFSNYASILNVTIAPLTDINQLANQVLDITVYSEVWRFPFFGRAYVVGAEDKLFWVSLGNTLKFSLFAVPFSVIPALILASLLNSKLPGMRIFRAIYFLPSVAAVVGIALVWQWLFNSTIGYINYGISQLIILLNYFGGDLADPAIRWLSSSDVALYAIVIMTAWRLIGFNTVLFLAGLQNIPGELYEAATVDGAGSAQQFRHVTLPLLAPTTFFVTITTVISTLQVFEDVFILMGQNPAGPGNSTLTLVLYLYQRGFQRFDQGYASAIAWVLFLLIFGATLLQFQRQRDNQA